MRQGSSFRKQQTVLCLMACPWPANRRQGATASFLELQRRALPFAKLDLQTPPDAPANASVSLVVILWPRRVLLAVGVQDVSAICFIKQGYHHCLYDDVRMLEKAATSQHPCCSPLGQSWRATLFAFLSQQTKHPAHLSNAHIPKLGFSICQLILSDPVTLEVAVQVTRSALKS